MRLPRVREAGMQGRLWQPTTSTHYHHGAQCLVFAEGGKSDGLENPHATAKNHRTTQLTYGPGRVSNQGHLGERQAQVSKYNG